MTDAALRELERTAHAGDIVSAARLLVARVRLGELTIQDLELAAHVGHEPAELALGIEPAQSAWTSICVTTDELVGAVHELQRFGREVLVVVSTTGVELVRPWRSVTEAEHLASAVPVEPIGEAAGQQSASCGLRSKPSTTSRPHRCRPCGACSSRR